MDLLAQRRRRPIAVFAASRARQNRLPNPLQPTATFPEQQEIERLHREVNKLKAEQDILKMAIAFFAMEAT